MTTAPLTHRRRGRRFIGARGRRLAGELLSSATAVAALMAVLAVIFRLATGQSPWPVFVLVEIPSATVAFALLTLASPR